MGSSDVTPLFVDTNLGTHLVVPVSPATTTGDLKRKLVQAHMSCFTNLGEIKVLRLMVKRRSHLYLLTDPMPINSAFQGISGTWFLQMHASMLPNTPASSVELKPPKPVAPSNLRSRGKLRKHQTRECRENQQAISNASNVTTSSDKNYSSLGNAEAEAVLENATEGSHLASDNPSASNNFSEKISITGIISRYFSDFDEVDSCSCHRKDKLEEVLYPAMAPSERPVDTVAMGTDTDTVCSVNNNLVDRKVVNIIRRKGKKNTRNYVPAKSGSSRKMFLTPLVSKKCAVGRRVSNAATNIWSSESGNSLSMPMFATRCRKLSSPVARNIAFDF